MRILLLAMAACSGGDETGTTDAPPDDTGEPVDTHDTDIGGACGAITTWHLTLLGTVLGVAGDPAAGAHVWVEERNWTLGTVVGDGLADAKGTFSLDLPEVTSVEDCWGTALDYVLVGERVGERAEYPLNIYLFNAIDDETFVADLDPFALQLEPAR